MADDEHPLVPIDASRNDAQQEAAQDLRAAILAMAEREKTMSNAKGAALNNAGVDSGAPADMI